MNIEINYEICTKCGLCSKVCGSKRIEIGEDKYPYKIISAGCNDCGHCVAVCPENAVRNKRMDMKSFVDMVDPGVSIEQFTHLVRNRRSIRNYKKEPLKKEHIDKLLGVANYIPTGSNKQYLKYKFITDKELLVKISSVMASKVRRASKLINAFPLKYFIQEKRRRSLSRLLWLYDRGDDTYLRGTPCLLIIYTDERYFKMPQWEAGIACSTIDLAAQTLGVATMMNGYFISLAKRYRSIKKLVQIPGKSSILAAMNLGYPDVKYRRTVYRRPLDVIIL
jgi:nitroreductase/NAD-dependent dihydropyrimidine dehydrogenase PreA subunit